MAVTHAAPLLLGGRYASSGCSSGIVDLGASTGFFFFSRSSRSTQVPAPAAHTMTMGIQPRRSSPSSPGWAASIAGEFSSPVRPQAGKFPSSPPSGGVKSRGPFPPSGGVNASRSKEAESPVRPGSPEVVTPGSTAPLPPGYRRTRAASPTSTRENRKIRAIRISRARLFFFICIASLITRIGGLSRRNAGRQWVPSSPPYWQGTGRRSLRWQSRTRWQ